jgi:integrase
VRWLEWIQACRVSGKRSSAWDGARSAIRALWRWRDLPAKSLGPRLFQEIRVELAATPFVRKKRIGDRVELVSLSRSRRHILDTMERVRQMIAFGVSEELIPGDRLYALQAVPRMPDDLGEHRPRRTAVPMEHYRATIERMTPTVRALVEFIAITGCRPAEAAGLRMVDLEDTGERVWKFIPVRHKSRWRGKPRIIPVGPRAQAILRRASAGKATDAVVFDARESLPTVPGTRTDRKPSSRVRGPYTSTAIRRAIVRAARDAGVPEWTTYQLRHLRLQEVRRTAGREAAQAVAGHNRSTMVDHYAPPSWEAGEAYAAVHG